jgi:DNA polymerase-1
MDCETTGLKWQRGDYAFLWSFATDNDSYIYDIRRNGTQDFYELLHERLMDPEQIILGVNPKFDLHMSEIQEYKAQVIDISIMRRLVHTNAMMVGLAAIAEEIGMKKDDEVKKWIQKNKAYRWEKLSSGEMLKIPRYDSVPDDIMYNYAAIDAEIPVKAYRYYMTKLSEMDTYNQALTIQEDKSLFKVLKKEVEVTRVLFNMEKRGFLLDEEYCKNADATERAKVHLAAEKFKELTGRDFKDSAKYFVELFGESHELIKNAPRTKKGALSFTDDYLSGTNNEIAETIIQYRKAAKKSGTYYSGFLDLCRRPTGMDAGPVPPTIHTNYRQPQTATGRLSASDPNLQNVSNEDSSDNQVRGCFISPPEYYLVSIDYQAQELRVMLDFAGETSVIQQVKGGSDLHQATADLMGVSRKEAKTINFGILYGMGGQKLADALGVSLDHAKGLKQKYMRSLVRVAGFIDRVIGKARKQGKITNLEGRVYSFDSGFEYKAINYLVQGSSAEITKSAMINCEALLKNYKSKMVGSIHDELVFYVHEDEVRHVVSLIAEAMKAGYKHRDLPMDVGIEIGKRWSEMEGYQEWLDKQNPISKIG